MTHAQTDTNRTLTAVSEEPVRCTFFDCLSGKVGAPSGPASKSMFQLLVLCGMITFMVTFNGVRHAGVDFFFESHWLYPIAFCLAFSLRLLVVNRLTGWILARPFFGRFTGFARNVAITSVNVAIMAPVMGSFVTVLLSGLDNLAANLASALPVSVAVAFCVNLLVVGPLVKYLYHHVLPPTIKARFVAAIQRNATSWAGILTN